MNHQLSIINPKIKGYEAGVITFLLVLASVFAHGQTPINMSAQPSLTFTEDFSAISTWTATAGAYSGATNADAWRGFASNTTTATANSNPGTIPNPVNFTGNSAIIGSTGFTTSGIYRGNQMPAPNDADAICIFAAGATDNVAATALDLHLDFTGVQAGTLSYNALFQTNPTNSGTPPTINRQATLRVYWSIDGATWTELIGASYNCTNQTPSLGFIGLAGQTAISNIALPSAFTGSANARLRFYNFNSTSAAGAGGSRPRVLIDDITVTAQSSCTTPITLNLNQPSSQIICQSSSVNVAATATGATGITYNWSTNNTPIASGLASFNNPINTLTPATNTIYTLTATSGSCSASSTMEIVVIQLPTVSVTPSVVSVVSGSSETLTASGASSYTWTPSSSLNSSMSATVIASPTATTTYTVTGSDLNGCVSTSTALVNVSAGVTVTSSISTATLTCAGESIMASLSGGNSYSVDPVFGTTIAGSNITFNPSANTIYTITGTVGTASATTIISITSNNNPLPNLVVTPSPAIVCAGSIATITASGADSYFWSGSSLSLNNTATVQSTSTVNTTYTVTGTSIFGCTNSTTVDLQVNALPVITITPSANPACIGTTLTLTATGGASYSWSTGGTSSVETTMFTGTTTYSVTATDMVGCFKINTFTVAGISSGATALYTMQNAPTGSAANLLQCNTNIASVSNLTSGNNNGTVSTPYPGGTGTATYPNQTATGVGAINAGAACKILATVDPLVNTYFEVTVTPQSGNAVNLNGISFASRSTGTGPTLLSIRTSIDNFASDVLTVPVLNNSTFTHYINGISSPVLSTTSAPLVVRIYGSNGTGSGGTGSVNWRLDDVTLDLSTSTVSCTIDPISVALTNDLCFGTSQGSLTITANGADNYNIGGMNQTTNIFTNLAAGVYTVTATNIAGGGCSTSTIAVINQPFMLNISGQTITDVTNCALTSGSINLNVIGGTLGYFYTLLPLNAGNTNGMFSNLAAGSYTLIATDANGCTVTSTASINILPNAKTTIDTTFCSGTVINISGTLISTTGSTTILTPASNGCQDTIIVNATVNPSSTGAPVSINVCSFPTSFGGQSFNASGVYTVAFTGANGCDSSIVLTIIDESIENFTGTSVNENCFGSGNGSIFVSATNAITYSLNGGAPQTTGFFSNLSQGLYNVTATSTNGCTASSSYLIVSPTLLTLNTIGTDPTCSSLGEISSISTGGTAPYVFTLLPLMASNTTGNFTSLLAGTYTIIVTDLNNCSSSSLAIINATTNSSISTAVTSPSCFGKNDGVINATLSGATFTIMPSLVQTSSGMFVGATAGNYTISATQSGGCSATTVVNVTQPALLTYPTNIISTPSCNGGSNGVITAVVNGGTMPYTFTSTPSKMQTIPGTFINVNTGIYRVNVVDANGCKVSKVFAVMQPAVITYTSVTKMNPTCNGSTNGVITAMSVGGTGMKSLSVSSSSSATIAGNIISGLGAGNYTVTATDLNSCIRTTLVTLSQPTIISFNNIVKLSPTSTTTGKIIVSAIGGTGSKVYSLMPGVGTQSPTGTFNNLPAGAYVAVATDANGCSQSTAITLVATANATFGVNSAAITEEKVLDETEIAISKADLSTFEVYPNPIINEAVCKIPTTTSTSVTVIIADVNGAVVKRINANINPLNNQVNINTNDIKVGMYMLSVQLGNGQRMSKLITKQ
jgi:large repetitive protein